MARGNDPESDTRSARERNRRRRVAAVMALATFAAAAAHVSVAARCELRIESSPERPAARLRIEARDRAECAIAERDYRRAVAGWLDRRAPGAPDPDSFFLGRAVRYPWLSTHLAQAAVADPAWDTERGDPREGHANAYVARLLGRPAMRRRLDAPFTGTSHRVGSVAVEKVLITTAVEVLDDPGDPTARVPYDAQVWLVLERRKQ